VAVIDGKVVLSPQNTTIQFVGTHVGPEPNPRVGYFTKFTGEVAIDRATGALTGITLNVETDSLVTPIERLTNHLKSIDFFDVRAYPEAAFRATRLEAASAPRGRYKVTGDLTIREVTKSISFPVTLKVTDGGAILTSKFALKRSDFGMTFGPDRVEDDVSMSVTIGRPTPKTTPQ
jgi:polyisoprenoid-binding protein YceI